MLAAPTFLRLRGTVHKLCMRYARHRCPPEKSHPRPLGGCQPVAGGHGRTALAPVRSRRLAVRSQMPTERDQEVAGWFGRQEQNGPTPLPLRRHSLVAMMQPAEDRPGDQLGGAGDRNISLRLRNRRIALESLVRPGNMVVAFDELPQ